MLICSDGVSGVLNIEQLNPESAMSLAPDECSEAIKASSPKRSFRGRTTTAITILTNSTEVS